MVGHLIAPHLYDDAPRAASLFRVLAAIGGLSAAMVFARMLRR